jgi:hypothetical protein
MTHIHPMNKRGIASCRAAHPRSVAQRPLPFAGRAFAPGGDS